MLSNDIYRYVMTVIVTTKYEILFPPNVFLSKQMRWSLRTSILQCYRTSMYVEIQGKRLNIEDK